MDLAERSAPACSLDVRLGEHDATAHLAEGDPPLLDEPPEEPRRERRVRGSRLLEREVAATDLVAGQISHRTSVRGGAARTTPYKANGRSKLWMGGTAAGQECQGVDQRWRTSPSTEGSG